MSQSLRTPELRGKIKFADLDLKDSFEVVSNCLKGRETLIYSFKHFKKMHVGFKLL